MKILFDQGTPVPLRQALADHHISTAFERGWHRMPDRALLDAAEREGFDLMVTTDRHLRHQQALAGRRLAILVLPTTDWRKIRLFVDDIARAINGTGVGAYVEVSFPAQ